MSRKRKVLSLGEKLKIIEEAEKRHGATKSSIARCLDIPESSLKTLLANKAVILQHASKFGLKRKVAKEGQHEELERVLVTWLHQARSSANKVDGATLKEKAELVASRLGIDDFQASNGWLDRFKKRNKIVCSRSCTDRTPVAASKVTEWMQLLPEMIAAYKPRDVFHADEGGIFYNMQPEQTLTHKGESCRGGKRSKERLTALFCANEDGSEKLPVFVIGKSAKPRCFENLRTLPCSYNFNKNAWMTSALFSKFLQQLDNEMGAKARKIMLFIDNAPCHPPDCASKLRNVKVVFLPPSCTRPLQPLNVGIIRCVKQGYRKRLVQRRLAAMERRESGDKVSVLDAMHFLASSWDAVPQSSIANSFKHCGFKREAASSAGDTTPSMDCKLEADVGFVDEDFGGVLDTTATFTEYVEADDNVAICGELSLEDAVDEALTRAETTVTSDEDDDSTDVAVPVPTTFADVLRHIDGIRNYICSCDDTENLLSDVFQLERKLSLLEAKKIQKKRPRLLEPSPAAEHASSITWVSHLAGKGDSLTQCGVPVVSKTSQTNIKPKSRTVGAQTQQKRKVPAHSVRRKSVGMSAVRRSRPEAADVALRDDLGVKEMASKDDKPR